MTTRTKNWTTKAAAGIILALALLVGRADVTDFAPESGRGRPAASRVSKEN